MSKPEKDSIDFDAVEEIRDQLIHAIERRRWVFVEEALELINDALGYENTDVNDESDDEEDES